MKRIARGISFLMILCILMSGYTGFEELRVSAAGYSEMDHISLKEIYKDDFLLGNIYNPWDQTGPKKELLLQHFNVITPENLLKPDAVQRNKGVFTFDAADSMVDFCEANNLKVVGHTFAWNQQTSAWMTETQSREEAIENLRTHINTVASRYKGRILIWDVVNEAIRDGAVLPDDGD